MASASFWHGFARDLRARPCRSTRSPPARCRPPDRACRQYQSGPPIEAIDVDRLVEPRHDRLAPALRILFNERVGDAQPRLSRIAIGLDRRLERRHALGRVGNAEGAQNICGGRILAVDAQARQAPPGRGEHADMGAGAAALRHELGALGRHQHRRLHGDDLAQHARSCAAISSAVWKRASGSCATPLPAGTGRGSHARAAAAGW